MRTDEVRQRLAEPTRAATATGPPPTSRVLEAAGAGPYKSDGRMVVGRDRVMRALANRDTDESSK